MDIVSWGGYLWLKEGYALTTISHIPHLNSFIFTFSPPVYVEHTSYNYNPIWISIFLYYYLAKFMAGGNHGI